MAAGGIKGLIYLEVRACFSVHSGIRKELRANRLLRIFEEGSPTKRPTRRAQCLVPLSKRLARKLGQIVQEAVCVKLMCVYMYTSTAKVFETHNSLTVLYCVIVFACVCMPCGILINF